MRRGECSEERGKKKGLKRGQRGLGVLSSRTDRPWDAAILNAMHFTPSYRELHRKLQSPLVVNLAPEARDIVYHGHWKSVKDWHPQPNHTQIYSSFKNFFIGFLYFSFHIIYKWEKKIPGEYVKKKESESEIKIFLWKKEMINWVIAHVNNNFYNKNWYIEIVIIKDSQKKKLNILDTDQRRLNLNLYTPTKWKIYRHKYVIYSC